MPIPGKGKWATLRCSWCRPRHLVDDNGYFIKGNAERPGVLYSDGMCRMAEKSENLKLDEKEAKKNEIQNAEKSGH